MPRAVRDKRRNIQNAALLQCPAAKQARESARTDATTGRSDAETGQKAAFHLSLARHRTVARRAAGTSRPWAKGQRTRAARFAARARFPFLPRSARRHHIPRRRRRRRRRRQRRRRPADPSARSRSGGARRPPRVRTCSCRLATVVAPASPTCAARPRSGTTRPRRVRPRSAAASSAGRASSARAPAS